MLQIFFYKGKNATTKSYGKTESKQSQVENNGVICLPANRSQQDSNFEQGVLPNRSRVHRGKIFQKAYVIYNFIINNISGLQKL
jgi:hypothetical protein